MTSTKSQHESLRSMYGVVEGESDPQGLCLLVVHTLALGIAYQPMERSSKFRV